MAFQETLSETSRLSDAQILFSTRQIAEYIQNNSETYDEYIRDEFVPILYRSRRLQLLSAELIQAFGNEQAHAPAGAQTIQILPEVIDLILSSDWIHLADRDNAVFTQDVFEQDNILE